MPGWTTSWLIIFDKNGYLNQIKQNLNVVSTIFLHNNKFTQEALLKILREVGLFTQNLMGKVQ